MYYNICGDATGNTFHSEISAQERPPWLQNVIHFNRRHVQYHNSIWLRTYSSSHVASVYSSHRFWGCVILLHQIHYPSTSVSQWLWLIALWNVFCRRIHEFDLILCLANKAIPDKNGVLDILNHMVNADFMLGQRRRQLVYINPALSILQRKQDRSTPTQCFFNVGPASQTMDQH